jgi:hypothetical protein
MDLDLQRKLFEAANTSDNNPPIKILSTVKTAINVIWNYSKFLQDFISHEEAGFL